MVEIQPFHVPGGVTFDASVLLDSLAEQTGVTHLHVLADDAKISGLELELPCVWRGEDSLTIYLSDMTIVGRDSRRMRFLQWVAHPTMPNFRRLWWKAWYGR